MKHIFRAGFGVLIAIEALGVLGILPEKTDFTWLGLIVTAACAWYVFEKFEVPVGIWAAGFAMIILDSISAIYLLYTRIPVWDKIIHTLGGATTALIALELLIRLLRKGVLWVKQPASLIVIGVLVLTATMGFIYEFLEYLVDRIYYGAPQTLVSAYNTTEDQLFNLLGASLVLAGHLARQRAARLLQHFTPTTAYAEEGPRRLR